MLFLDGQLRSVSVSASSPWFSSFSWSSSADRLQNRSPGAKKFLSSPAPSSGFSHLNSARIMIPYRPAISRRISCNQWCWVRSARNACLMRIRPSDLVINAWDADGASIVGMQQRIRVRLTRTSRRCCTHFERASTKRLKRPHAEGNLRLCTSKFVRHFVVGSSCAIK